MENKHCNENYLFKVSIIEDSEIHREWLKMELFDYPEVRIVSIDRYGRDDVESVRRYKADVALLDEHKLAEIREREALAHVIEETKARAKAEEELRQVITILTGSIVHDLRTPLINLGLMVSIIQKCCTALIDSYHIAQPTCLQIKSKYNDLCCKIDMMMNATAKLKQIMQQMKEFIDITLKALNRAMHEPQLHDDLHFCSILKCINKTLNYYPFNKEEAALIKWDQGDHFDFVGNEILFIRVLYNLLNNAFDQIRKNQRGNIIISTETKNDMNILRFRDTAGGALPEMLDHLFDAYQTTKEKGTGIGLAFCKLTMKHFGGDIICHSVYGDCIEFILKFPKISTIRQLMP